MTQSHLRELPLRELKRQHVVVCVDDELPVLASLRRQLRGEPYELVTTTDPEVALEWIRERDVSLLVTDQKMPGMTGDQLLDAVRSCSPGTSGVLLTGYVASTLTLDSLPRKVRWMIGKPWDGATLKRAVRELLYEREMRLEAVGWPGK